MKNITLVFAFATTICSCWQKIIAVIGRVIANIYTKGMMIVAKLTQLLREFSITRDIKDVLGNVLGRIDNVIIKQVQTIL